MIFSDISDLFLRLTGCKCNKMKKLRKKVDNMRI